jgi:putative oxidoreductase
MSEEFEGVDRSRLMVPGLAGLYERLAPLGYALVRVVTGLLILPGGYEKLFHGGVYRIAANNIAKVGVEPPLAWAWAVGCTEFFGAILLAIGLWTRPAAFSLVVLLGTITFRVRWDAGYFWKSTGWEVTLLLALVCLAYLMGGGGRWSLDRRIGREF